MSLFFLLLLLLFFLVLLLCCLFVVVVKLSFPEFTGLASVKLSAASDPGCHSF